MKGVPENMAKRKGKGKGKKARAKARRIYTGVIVAVVIVIVVFAVRYIRTGGDVASAENYSRGVENATVVVEEFSDFR